MQRLINYSTITWELDPGQFDGAAAGTPPDAPGRLAFDQITPGCRDGTLVPRFRFSWRTDASVDSLQLYLRDPRDDRRRRPLIVLPAAAGLTYAKYDCCCQGELVPFIRGQGPVPRYELILVTTGDEVYQYVSIDYWFEINQHVNLEGSIG